MRVQTVRALIVAGASLWLAGCNTTIDPAGLFEARRPGADAYAAVPPPPSSMPETTGSIAPRDKSETPGIEAPKVETPKTETAAPGAGNAGDIAKGRAQFRAGNYAEAELSFRHAAEMNPRDAEAWLGLAACFDRMRRFELADRAYVQATAIKGPTAEILNNQGYSYLLRGDYARARATLTAARDKDPGNHYVQNNLQLVEQKEHSAGAGASPKAQ